MLIALLLSIVFSLAVGILAARRPRAEAVIIPLLDVFQSIPILGFFPIVIAGVIAVIPGVAGVNLAVILLIFTSMSWNITFGVYEAVKSIPQEYVELAEMSGASSTHKLTSLYIPASLGRIAYNTQTSWAVGLFYLSVSEILTIGTKSGTGKISVSGISTVMFQFSAAGDYSAYIYAFALLMLAVVVWQLVFLREFASWADRYKFVAEPQPAKRDPLMKFYHWVNDRSISKLFLLTHDRGVNRFTSSLSRFRRGLKYALLISAAIFAALELPAVLSTTSHSLSSMPSLGVVAADEGAVLYSLAFSFARIWYIYFVCVAVAVPVAISIGLNDRAYDVLSPVIEVIASIPAPLLLPALYVLFIGQGEGVAFAIIFLGMIWYILFNVVAGIRSLPAEILELKKAFHLSTLEAWRDIYLPASATAFVTGSITAIGGAWNTLIVAEFFQLSSTQTAQVGAGIGKLIDLSNVQTCANVAAQTGCRSGTDWTLFTLAILSMTGLVVIFNLTVWRRVYHYVTKRYTYNR
jgi:NitT/TauT family transport system permease protein